MSIRDLRILYLLGLAASVRTASQSRPPSAFVPPKARHTSNLTATSQGQMVHPFTKVAKVATFLWQWHCGSPNEIEVNVSLNDSATVWKSPGEIYYYWTDWTSKKHPKTIQNPKSMVRFTVFKVVLLDLSSPLQVEAPFRFRQFTLQIFDFLPQIL